MKTRHLLKRIVFLGLLVAGCAAGAPERWNASYEPQVFEGMPCRVMKPLGFDSKKSYPVIVSLHGAGGKGTNNDKQLKDWNKQLAEKQRRKDFPCYVVAPQAAGLWNAEHLKKIKALIKGLPSVDMDRIYVLGHSMGGHGTYIFIPLDPGSQLLQRLYGIDFRSATNDDVVLILFTKLSQRYFNLLSVGALKVHHTFRKRKELSFDSKFS